MIIDDVVVARLQEVRVAELLDFLESAQFELRFSVIERPQYALDGDGQTARRLRLPHFREAPAAEVGVTLLNQRVIAGLGNVYKSEVAFAARVNPFRAIGTLSRNEMERIVEIAQRYMKANVGDGKGGIVTNSGNRRTIHAMNSEERLWVYRRQGQQCRRCGTSILLRKQGSQARVTFWCPDCQPFF